MADQSMNRQLGIIIYLKIHMHVIPYISTFTILKNNVVDYNYFVLLRRPWLKNVKLTHD
jgi:hypothetical protein